MLFLFIFHHIKPLTANSDHYFHLYTSSRDYLAIIINSITHFFALVHIFFYFSFVYGTTNVNIFSITYLLQEKQQSDRVMRSLAYTSKYIYISICILLLLHSCEAVGAVNWSVTCGLERNFSFLTALCTNCCEHLLLCSCSVLSCIAASLASLGFVLESLLSIELLLACGEYELIAALFAY